MCIVCDMWIRIWWFTSISDCLCIFQRKWMKLQFAWQNGSKQLPYFGTVNTRSIRLSKKMQAIVSEWKKNSVITSISLQSIPIPISRVPIQYLKCLCAYAYDSSHSIQIDRNCKRCYVLIGGAKRKRDRDRDLIGRPTKLRRSKHIFFFSTAQPVVWSRCMIRVLL